MKQRKGAVFPLILLLLSAYAFWILPSQLEKPKMHIKFERPTSP